MADQAEQPFRPTPLAVAVFLFAIAALTFAAVFVVQMLPQAFSRLADLSEEVATPAELAQISATYAPRRATSGVPFSFTWTGPQATGRYELRVSCDDAVLRERTPDGAVAIRSCDTPFLLPESENSVDLTITLPAATEQEIPYTLRFLPESTAVRAASTTGAFVITTPTPAATSTAPAVHETADTAEPETDPAAHTTQAESAYRDLTLSHITLGALTPSGTFVPREIVSPREQAALRFQVTNEGTLTSHPWTARVTLPDGGVYTLPGEEAPLAPGATRTVLLRIDGAPYTRSSYLSFVVTVISHGERTTANNQAILPLRAD